MDYLEQVNDCLKRGPLGGVDSDAHLDDVDDLVHDVRQYNELHPSSNKRLDQFNAEVTYVDSVIRELLYVIEAAVMAKGITVRQILGAWRERARLNTRSHEIKPTTF